MCDKDPQRAAEKNNNCKKKKTGEIKSQQKQNKHTGHKDNKLEIRKYRV